MNATASIVSKVWSFCTTLRDDGVGYGDYLEQLTYLIFLKMADEYSQPPYNREVGIPAEYNWQSLRAKRGAELEVHYVTMLRELGNKSGMLGTIFTKAQNKIQDPAKLYRLIDMVNETEWVTMGADVKGDIYEGLLERNAEDTKSGAGQYFTPRALIRAMVECIRPEPNKTIADPACGTGGFFLAAYDFLVSNYQMNKPQNAFLKNQTFYGNEIVAGTRRLALMNMFLHNIGEIDGESMISPNDALVASAPQTYDYVLANPPFGKKSSMSFTNEEGEQEKDDLTYNRQDFWATTSNKQLNFVQHIRTMLKTTGRAAVVVPDNVLFEGGAGETVRKKLMENTDLHTILRLPTGIFYANGVKANVLFFDNHAASKEPWTKEIWFYDYRTNIHHTLKKKPLRFEDLQEFIDCYHPQNRFERKETWNEQNNPDGRWRKFSYEQLIARDKTSLDVFWLKDKSLADLDNLPEPDDLAMQIVENLGAALQAFQAIATELQKPLASVTDIADARREKYEARTAIGCYVVDKLANQPTFGRTVQMKHLYLAEAHLGLELGGEPIRDAAGPYDNWIMDFESQAIQQKWFAVTEKEISDGRKKITYKTGANLKQKADDALPVLGQKKNEFDRILDLLKDKSTEEVEIVATLFAAWNDALLDGLSPSDDDTIREVRENWHPSKERFSAAVLQKWLDWMGKNRLIPTGKSPRTRYQGKLL